MSEAIDNANAGNELVLRIEQDWSREIFGGEFKFEWAVVYLPGGFFYIEFPREVEVVDLDEVKLDAQELEAMKSSILDRVLEELKRYPYYTMYYFGLQYIPNPDIDPDFDPSINPFEKWGGA